MAIAGLIMAAGAASRFGSPKQLLPINGKLLINHIIEVSASVCSEVHVVLGANGSTIAKQILPETPLIFNENWEEGIGCSISRGVRKLMKDSKIQAIIILLADQACLSRSHLSKLIDCYHQKLGGIVCTQYDKDSFGPPLLIDRKYFHDFVALQGDNGGKAILKKNRSDLYQLKADFLTLDIDTVEDYTILLKAIAKWKQ